MIASLPISASFHYWGTSRQPNVTEGYAIASGLSPDIKAHTSKVKDVRQANENFTLDKNGFAFIKHRSSLVSPLESPPRSPSECDDERTLKAVAAQFQDPDFVTQNYWPEACAALREHLISDPLAKQNSTGGKPRSSPLVIPMQTSIRTSEVDKFTPPTGGPSRMNLAHPPARKVHCDYSPYGARTVLRSMLTTYLDDVGIATLYSAEDREAFLARRDEIIKAEDDKMKATNASGLKDWDSKGYDGPRWAIYSLWRAFEPVRRDPLGLVDARSMFDLSGEGHAWEDTYMRIPLPHKGRVGFLPEYQMWNITPYVPGFNQATDKEYQWYYMKDQQPDDLLIIKLFDSEAWKDRSTGIVPASAHSAFRLPDQENERPRRSIEVRILVMW